VCQEYREDGGLKRGAGTHGSKSHGGVFTDGPALIREVLHHECREEVGKDCLCGIRE